MSWSKEAVDFLQKLRGVKKFDLSTQEKQMLNISEENIEKLKSPSLNKDEFGKVLLEIVSNSIKNPKFRSLIRKNPSEASDILASFLRHLRSQLPAQNIGYIDPDAHDQSKKLLTSVMPKKEISKAPTEADPFKGVSALPSSLFEHFNLKSPDNLKDLSEKDITERYLQYFLGKEPKEFITDKGKKKKEYSQFFKDNKENPELLEKYLLSFYKLVHDIKSKEGLVGKRDAWLKDPNIRRKVKKEVENSLKSDRQVKEEMGLDSKTSDIAEVMDDVRHSLFQVRELKNSIRGTFGSKDIKSLLGEGKKSIQEQYQSLAGKIDGALPTVNTMQVYINDINDEVQELGLSKKEFSLLYGESGNENFSFSPPELQEKASKALESIKEYIKEKTEDKKVEKAEEITKEVTASEDIDKDLQGLLDKAESHNLGQDETFKNYVERYRKLKSLQEKNLSKLNDLISSYLEMLSKHEKDNKEKFSDIDISDINEVSKDFFDFAKSLEDLAKEQEFNMMWSGRSRLFCASDDNGEEALKGFDKIAAFKSDAYTKAFQKFKSSASALKKISTLYEMAEPGGLLDQIHKKLLSSVEATSQDKYNPFEEDFSDNPLKGKPITIRTTNKEGELEDVPMGPKDLAKKLKSIANSLKKITPGDLYDKANSILKKQSDLSSVLSFPRTAKKAHADYIRKFAYKLVNAIKDPKGPGVLVYRQRQTPLGKKALNDIFKDDKYIQEFIREMEKAGLNALADHEKSPDEKKKSEKTIVDEKGTQSREEVEKERLEKILSDKVDVFKILTGILNKMFKERQSEKKEGGPYKEQTLDQMLSKMMGSPEVRSIDYARDLEKAKDEYINSQLRLRELSLQSGAQDVDVYDEGELNKLGFTDEDKEKFRDKINNQKVEGIGSLKKKTELINKLFPLINDPDKMYEYVMKTHKKKQKDTIDSFKELGDLFEKVKSNDTLYFDVMTGQKPVSQQGREILQKYNRITGQNLSKFPDPRDLKKFINKVKEGYEDLSFHEEKRIRNFKTLAENFFKPSKSQVDQARRRTKERRDVRRLLGEPGKGRGIAKAKIASGPELMDLRRKIAHLKQLKEDLLGVSDTEPVKGGISYIDSKIASLSVQVKSLQTELILKVAAGDPYGPQKSQYDVAIETKGVDPLKYEKELRPDVPFKSQKYVDQIKDVIEFAKSSLNEYKKLYEQDPKKTLENHGEEIKFFRTLLKNADEFKKVAINIGEHSVPILSSLKELSDLIGETLEGTSKRPGLSYIRAQKNIYDKRLQDAKEKIENLKTYIDPKSGESKALPETELESYKKMILKRLYSSLESYWANFITRQLSPLGERDTEYYNKVYEFFKNQAGVKSNRKLMKLLNDYKSSIRKEIDDTENWDKIEELEKAKEALIKGYRAYDIDPDKSPKVKSLTTKINTLQKHKKQVESIFNEMSGHVRADINKAVEDSISKQIKGENSKENEDALKEAKEKLEKQIAEDLEKTFSEAPEYTVQDLAEQAVEISQDIGYEDKVKKLLGDIAKGKKDKGNKGNLTIDSPKELHEAASAVLLHKDGDHKYIFVVGTQDEKKSLSKSGILKPYQKGKKPYKAFVDTYTIPSITSKGGVWVGTQEEVKSQIESLISSGVTGFDKLVPGGDKGISTPEKSMKIEKKREEVKEVKRASYRNDINFNERILYSKSMQQKISSLLDSTLEKIKANK